MTQIKRLKRISVKELLGLSRGDNGAAEIKKLLDQGVEKIYRITGNVTGYGVKNTQYGESFKLTGDFLAQNLVTGEIFDSNNAYLPKTFSEDLVNAFKNRSENQSGVEFTAEVAITKDSASATGYSYDVAPIQTAETMAWKTRALQGMLALPAPQPKMKAVAGKK